MSGTNLPDLGSPPTRLDPELRKWLVKAGEHIRELRGFTGDVAGQAGSGGGGGGTVVIPGAPPPAPAPGPADPPDLTPPPTPSGVAVTAGLNAIYIETDAPTFTQGHGYARTLVYGAKYPGTGPLPTFSSAVLVHEFIGEIGSFPSDLGTQWHIWVKWLTEDNVPSSIASGGTNGHVATTGKIGNADLGPLIVEAGNLASGAVTAAKLAAGAVGLTAFAAGLTPVEIVATLPASGNYSGRTVVLTTDGKLYRYIAGAWTKAVDGADLVANSITTGKIAAGAVTADQLAAGAVRTNKLLVAPSVGGFVNADPLVQDSQAWTFANVSGAVPAYYPNFNGGPGLNSAWDKNDGGCAYIFGPRFAISADRTYEIKSTLYLWASSSATFYLLVAFYDAQGNLLLGSSFPGGWPGVGDRHYYGRINQTLAVGYNTYTHKFGANASSAIPAQAAYAQVGVLGSYNNAAGRWSWGGAQVREIIPGELIVDGAITATKIAANAIAVGTAAIQNGAIVNAMIANATIDSAKIASLAVSKLTAGSLSIGAFIQSSGYIPGVTGFRFDGNGFAELGAAAIRDQLTASQIAAWTITAGRAIIADGTINTAKIEDASITNAKIGDTIQSVGYSPGVSGWFIRKSDGFAEFGAASIRGKLAAGNIAGSTVVGGVYNSYFFALSGGQAVVNQSFTSGIELTLDQPLSGGDYSVQGSITGYLGVITNVSFAGGGGTYMVELAMVFDLQLWNGSSWGTVGQGVYDLQQDIILTGNQTFRFPFHATIDGLQSGLASYSKARILVRVGAGGFKQLAVNGGGAKTDALSSITMFMKDSLRQFPN